MNSWGLGFVFRDLEWELGVIGIYGFGVVVFELVGGFG